MFQIKFRIIRDICEDFSDKIIFKKDTIVDIDLEYGLLPVLKLIIINGKGGYIFSDELEYVSENGKIDEIERKLELVKTLTGSKKVMIFIPDKGKTYFEATFDRTDLKGEVINVESREMVDFLLAFIEEEPNPGFRYCIEKPLYNKDQESDYDNIEIIKSNFIEPKKYSLIEIDRLFKDLKRVR